MPSMMRRRREARPDLPGDAEARMAAHPKPQYREITVHDPIDTRRLQLRKVHPDREPAFLNHVRSLACAVAGHALHPQCWNLDFGRNRAAHCGKALSGRLKRTDRQVIPLCDLAHDEQERDMDRFDQKYEINRIKIADGLWAEYCAMKGREVNG